MGNLTIIILTVILVILFGLFAIGTIAEFNRMGTEPYEADKKEGGVLSLKKFFGKLLG